MNIKARVEQLLFSRPSEERLYKKLLLSPLYLLSLIYRFLVQSRQTLYSTGILKSFTLPCRVISIGNITLGGTGKTPTAIYLAQLFQARGMKTVVLSRGYKGTSSEKAAVVSDGKRILLDVREAGDEPFLLSKALPGVPIIIGKNRVVAGQCAIEQFSPEMVILDDGFQHVQLKRDVDIVLIDLHYGFGNGHLVPRGMLREPLSSMKRANIFLLTKRIDARDDQAVEEKIISLTAGAPIFFTHYEINCLTTLHEDKQTDPRTLHGKKVLALSGIGNPHYFSYLLRLNGLSVTEEVILPDHHYYTPQDASMLGEYLSRVDCIVTTTKDSSKMDREMFKKLPILTLEVMLKIQDEQGFKEALFKHIS
jgi:tetraacyldisaccharide 4'-kinase